MKYYLDIFEEDYETLKDMIWSTNLEMLIHHAQALNLPFTISSFPVANGFFRFFDESEYRELE